MLPTFPAKPAEREPYSSWAAGVHSKVFYCGSREIDIAADYGVVVNDPTTAVAQANTAAINTALTDVMGMGRTVRLPQGLIYISGAITAYNVSGDTNADTTIVGSGGNHNSRLQVAGAGNVQDIFTIKAASGTIRGLVFDNFELWLGGKQFNLSRASYNTWRDVRIRGNNGTYAIYADNNSVGNTFSQCWAYENPLGNCIGSFNGSSLRMENCQFGEATGSILCSGGELELIGTRGWGMSENLGGASHLSPGGTHGAMFNVVSGGRLQILGGTYEPTTDGSLVDSFYVDNHERVQVIGSRFTARPGAYFLTTTTTATTGKQMEFTGNGIRFEGAGQLHNRASGNFLRTQWVGNKIRMASGFTVTTDDSMFDAGNGNLWADNDVNVV